MNYPIKCKIIDVDGKEVFPGLMGKTPEISKDHIGKEGMAEKFEGTVKITLNDGNVLYGYDCWWEPIDEELNKQHTAALI